MSIRFIFFNYIIKPMRLIFILIFASVIFSSQASKENIFDEIDINIDNILNRIIQQPSYSISGSFQPFFSQPFFSQPFFSQPYTFSQQPYTFSQQYNPKSLSYKYSNSFHSFIKPSEKPSLQPTEKPTEKPSEKPTEKPSEKPTEKPSEKPTEKPSLQPTEKPSENPSLQPTEKPSPMPSEKTQETSLTFDTQLIMLYPYYDFTNITKESLLYAQSKTMDISLDNIQYKETIHNNRRRLQQQQQYNLVFVSTITTITTQNASQQYEYYISQLNQSLSQGQFQLLANSIYYQYNITPEYTIQTFTVSPPVITILNTPTPEPTTVPTNSNREHITAKFEGWKIAAIVMFMCVVYILLTLNYYKPYSKFVSLKASIRDRILHFIENDHECESPNQNIREDQIGVEPERTIPNTLYEALLHQIVPQQDPQVPDICIRDFNGEDAREILDQLENGKIDSTIETE